MASEDFERLLAGGTLPGYDQTWALIRLLDYAWILRPGDDDFRRGLESLVSQVMNGADDRSQ